jgi:phage gp36-like protein
MVYATIEDFEMAFGERETTELSDLEDPTNEGADISVIENALQLASSEIDGYLRAAGYKLPLTTPLDILRGFCLDIARYRLDINLAREDVRLRYKAAIDFLKGLVNGLTQLPIGETDSGPTAVNEAVPAVRPGRTAVFTQDFWGY